MSETILAARKTAPPTGTPCRTAKPRKREYKLFDGGGLDLLVQSNGRKGGRLRYVKPDGREGLTALSSYPVIRLFHWEETGALDSAAALIAFGFAATSLLT